MRQRVVVWFLVAAVLLFAASAVWRFLRPRREKPPIPAHVRIDVVNGCGVARAGRSVMREMLAAGFNVYAVRNSDRYLERTIVIDRMDRNGRNACAVARALEVPRCLLGLDFGLRARPECGVEIDSTKFVDAEVVIGSDYPVFFPNARTGF